MVFLVLIIVSISVIFTQSACNKDDDTGNTQQSLTVDFPRLNYKHDLYYSLDHQARSIEMVFEEALNPNSIYGNIIFSDKSGSLASEYDIEVSGKALLLVFNKDFELKDGWKYELTLKSGLESTTGILLKEELVIEIRTSGKHIFTSPGLKGQNDLASQRNSIIAISDIHMGDERASDRNYCWFGKNAEALESLLDSILYGNQVRQLVIQGDLFDEWIVPYSVSPFDPESGINNSLEYFKAIAESPINVGIFDKLKAIAALQDIELIYIPGNHDMKMMQEYLEEIIPGIIWKGDVDGLGSYSPSDGIIMEHGHRYDFFNCPQPLVNPGHELPPGYFISRLYAQGMMETTGTTMKSFLEKNNSGDFVAAWTLAIIYTLGDFNMTVPPLDSPIILMGGIDGYTDPFSFNSAQDMYAANIQDLWPETQTENAVPVPMDVLFAIWHGYDLTSAALYEYLQQSPTLSAYNIVSFGHSHDPSVQVFPAGNEYAGIYANSGSWIDADQCSHDVRTYLVIKPAAWTGSDLDVVMLHQITPNSNAKNNKYLSELIAEENVEAK